MGDRGEALRLKYYFTSKAIMKYCFNLREPFGR